jgi:hypothetical protein
MSRLYTLWSEMQELCRNLRHPLYYRYGGRQIRVSADWRDFAAFRTWAHKTAYHGGAYLFRLDEEGDFSPENCAWTTYPEHADLGAGSPRLYEAFGLPQTLEAWGRDPRCRVSVSTLRKRLAADWPLERALTTPARPRPTLVAFGERKTVIEWTRDPRCVVRASTLRGRLLQGWAAERALSTPLTEAQAARTPRLQAFGEPRPRSAWLKDPRCLASRAALKRRLQCGWTAERALTIPTGFARNRHRLTAFDETKSLLAWTRDPRCHIGAKGLLGRLRQGWNPEEALSLAPHQDALRTLAAFGDRRTLAAWMTDPRCVVHDVRLVRQRLRQGWAVEAALTTPGKLAGPPELSAFGETKPLRAWADDPRCVVPRTHLRGRLRRGWPLERALTTPAHHSTQRKLLPAFGESQSLADWIRDPRCVVAQATVCARMKRGWTLEAALTTPALPYPHSKSLLAFGERKAMSEWLRDPRCRVGRDALNVRLAQGWAPETALTTPPGARRGQSLAAFGETHSLTEWAADPRCVVSAATLTARLSAGWPVDDALTTPPFHRMPTLTAFGETHSLADWAADPRCVVSRTILLGRLRAGWPAQEALTRPTRRSGAPTPASRSDEAAGSTPTAAAITTTPPEVFSTIAVTTYPHQEVPLC